MIIINRSSTAKLTDPSVVSVCMLDASILGTGLSGIRADRPAVLLRCLRGSSQPRAQ